MRYRAGVDIGGTFTDFALYDEQEGRLHTGKRLTTPRDPSVAALAGLFELLDRHGASAADVAQVLHATTLATNLVLERRGTTTALVVTRGYGDLLEIGRQKRWDTYDLRVDRRPPIVPRRYVYELSERLAHDGSVITPLDEAEVRALARTLVAAGVTSVGICLIHAYRNAAHEQAVARILAEDAPSLIVSSSSDVSPIWREYERANTVAVNAYVRPAVSAYMRQIASALERRGYAGRLLIMQSNGGLASIDVVEHRPVAMLESGPAAGALMASFYGDLTGARDIISFDMGGTTAKACLIENGTPTVRGQFEIATEGYKPGSGYPIATPSIDMIEIGAGGGSIARVVVGIIAVGPRSAGADPGPVCYGLGGTEPTVTDADVVLGYVNPEYFAGGTMTLDREAADRAIEERIARPLGITTPEAAWGIHHLVNLNMANATRAVSLKKGYDPRRFTFVAFGGAGPVHGARVAMDLGCPRVVFPAAAGVASAIGLLVVEPRFDLARTTLLALERDDVMATIVEIYAALEADAIRLLHASGVRDGIRIVRSADMRFAGQGSEVTTAIPSGALGSLAVATLRQAFHDAYRRRFGYADPAVPVQGVTWRVVASGPAPRVTLEKFQGGDTEASSIVKGTRQVYWPESRGYVATPIYDRYQLTPGSQIVGPAIVEEPESTTAVPPGCDAIVDEWLNLTVTLPEPSSTAPESSAAAVDSPPAPKEGREMAAAGTTANDGGASRMAVSGASRTVDPITLASVWNGLIAAAEEVGIAIRSTAFTEAIREGDDFSVGVFDTAGRMVAQGNFSPGHLGAMPFTMKQFLAEWPLERWSPGDAAITNDPLIGTGHFPDFCMAAPVFVDDRPVAFVVATCHHIDVGGAAPGSQQVEGIIDFYQEGLHVPPVRMYEKGEPVPAVFRIIAANSREQHILDDFQAQRNALEHHGVPRVKEIVRRYGLDTVRACFDAIIDRTEAAVRAEIRKLPPGRHTYENVLEDYGPGTPPVEIKVAIEIKGDEIVVDFAGSSPQVPAGINSYISYTRAYVYCALKCLLNPEIPQNEGGIRPITVTAPEGSYFNPRYGAGCGARAMNSMRIAESVLAAMASVCPRAVAPYGGWSHFCFGGIDQRSGRRIVGTEILSAGHGARLDRDGIDFLIGPFNVNNLPSEPWEAAVPLRVEKLQTAMDSEGAGKYRGSPGLHKEIRFLMDDWIFANLAEKEKHVPPGLLGGGPGARGSTVLVRDGEERTLEGKGTYTGMKHGDLIKITVGGGAGCGDPLERDVEAVWKDVVVSRFVSVAGARQRYGVVIDPATLEVNVAETKRLRASIRPGGKRA